MKNGLYALLVGTILSLGITASAIAANQVSVEDEKALVEAFRYRKNTVVEIRYDRTTQETACLGVCTCTAEYKVVKVIRKNKEIDALKRGDTVKLPYKCSGFQPTSPFSPAKWGTRLSNRNILMEIPHYLLENTDQNEWFFGRNRGFVPLFPRNLKW